MSRPLPCPEPSSIDYGDVVDVVGWDVHDTEDKIVKIMSRFGRICRIVRWQGSTEKQHAYIQYSDSSAAQAASRSNLPPKLAASVIAPDPIHRERFRSFIRGEVQRHIPLPSTRSTSLSSLTTATRMSSSSTSKPQCSPSSTHQHSASAGPPQFSVPLRAIPARLSTDSVQVPRAGLPKAPSSNDRGNAKAPRSPLTHAPLSTHSLSDTASATLTTKSDSQPKPLALPRTPDAPRSHLVHSKSHREPRALVLLPPTPEIHRSPKPNKLGRNLDIVIADQIITLTRESLEETGTLILLRAANAESSTWLAVSRELLQLSRYDAAERVIRGGLAFLQENDRDPQELRPLLLFMSTIYAERAKLLPAGPEKSDLLQSSREYVIRALGEAREHAFDQLRDISNRMALSTSGCTNPDSDLPITEQSQPLPEKDNTTYELQSVLIRKRELEDELVNERSVRRKLDRKVKDLGEELTAIRRQVDEMKKAHAADVKVFEAKAVDNRRVVEEVERRLSSLHKMVSGAIS